MNHSEVQSLKPYFEKALAKYGVAHLDSDPVGLVREFSAPLDREVAAVFAAGLALGRVSMIRSKLKDLFTRWEQAPAEFLLNESPRRIKSSLRGFRHRFYGEDEIAVLAINCREILAEGGTLEAAWPSGGAPIAEGLDQFAQRLSRPVRGITPRSTIPLLPFPARGSTCKRSVMLLRWLIRPDDGVDLGLWSCLSPSELVIPLDTHVFRLARLLGLTQRKTASWKAALEITENLRHFDRDDPVRYDFALSRIGIVDGCRGRYHADICSRCSVRPVCTEGKAPGKSTQAA